MEVAESENHGDIYTFYMFYRYWSLFDYTSGSHVKQYRKLGIFEAKRIGVSSLIERTRKTCKMCKKLLPERIEAMVPAHQSTSCLSCLAREVL